MKKRKIKWGQILALLILIVSIFFLAISIINIIRWNIDKHNTNKQIEHIEEIARVEEVKDNDETEIIEQATPPPPADPYWDYINLNMIYIDFSELQLINSDVKGWIEVSGTNINYPFVQASNNKYYLNHSFDKSYNQAGWVFMDYRNNSENFDKNTILYAHGRADTTMFGSLKNILKSNWYNNSDNHVIKLSTEYENTLWQVFSVYRIETTSDYLYTNFDNDEKYLEFLNLLLNRSVFNFNTSVDANDSIITLSTCYNKTDKIVMHAKLIKAQKR